MNFGYFDVVNNSLIIITILRMRVFSTCHEILILLYSQTHENPDGSITFACQHGPVECHANKIHSCATRHIKDKNILIKYISCMINNNYEPERIGIEVNIIKKVYLTEKKL